MDVPGTINPTTDEQWPFSRAALTVGLRRYLADSSLRLNDIRPLPLPPVESLVGKAGTKLRALSVGVQVEGEDRRLPLFLKEPPVSAGGRVLTAIGQREYGIYSKIAPHLPVLVPALVAGDEKQGWIVLEGLTGLRAPAEWTADDYREAIDNMVSMHDRFIGSHEVLSMYPWLARPLADDFDATTLAAAESVRILVVDKRLPQLSEDRYFELYSTLIQEAAVIAAPLRGEPPTLIHGDYWPGNIARPIDGRQMVFDWQLAAIGPAMLDLVIFVQSSFLQLDPPISADEMIQQYRQQNSAYMPPGWSDEQFALLWDHALMWTFMATWLNRLATMQPEAYNRIHDRFHTVWIEPVIRAVERRLK
jgi:aminoglycoside/choline kinase family phosphotransferase